MVKKVVLLAAKNHAKFIVDICHDAAIRVHGFLDDTFDQGHKVMGYPVLGGFSLIEDSNFRKEFEFFVAMGTPKNRLHWGRRLLELGASVANIIHPTAAVSRDARMGAGTLINSFVTMHVDAELGDFVCVDNHCTVAHHVELADGVNFSPGVRAMGSVKCGETTFVGAGAVLIPRIEIGARTVVGAGAVVTRDAPSDVTIVGNPAKIIQN